MPKYHIALIQPKGYAHGECFREVAETLEYALRALGHAVAIGVNTLDAQATNILLGAHLLSEEEAAGLPSSTILYNLEQLGGARLPAWYMALASRLRVWEYSQLNLLHWQQLPCLEPPVLVRIGYAPVLRRIAPAPVQDIDVLFYGSMNERRARVLQALQTAGLTVHYAFGVYGRERDGLIARAKVVLNLHFYPTEIFEIVRVSYLLANGKAVVSEQAPDMGELADAVAACPYEELVDRCLSLARGDGERRSLEQRGAKLFATREQKAILREVLGPIAQPNLQPGPGAFSAAAAFPRRLNLGSGKDWREDWLNIDVNEYWRPDAVLDLSQPLPAEIELATERFGSIRLGPGCLEAIVANDVLEHIPNLTGAMSAALHLLAEGGRFHIQVPYDLSWGSWQDPTHVRAFNERSWLYYTDWFWYLGWTESRFSVESLEFVLSAVGEELQSSVSREELLRTPRAVDSMQVVLRKQRLTDAEQAYVQSYLKRPERPATGSGVKSEATAV